MLQWGHVVVDVEGRRRGDRPIGVASRFNGATSSSTWKAGCALRSLASRSSFNGATSSSTWKAPLWWVWSREFVASMGPRRRRRGRDRPGIPWGPGTVAASMGPRRRRRGRGCWPRGSVPATVLQWGHVVVDVEGKARAARRLNRLARFNGATSSSTWKGRPRRCDASERGRFNGAM